MKRNAIKLLNILSKKNSQFYTVYMYRFILLVANGLSKIILTKKLKTFTCTCMIHSLAFISIGLSLLIYYLTMIASAVYSSAVATIPHKAHPY